jgi:hypothetical protein
VAMIGALFASDPERPVPDAPAWRPRPAPRTWALFTDVLRWRILATTGVLARMRHPYAMIARLHLLARQAGDLAREGRAPRVSINVPVSGRRRLMLVRADLDQANVPGPPQPLYVAGAQIVEIFPDRCRAGKRHHWRRSLLLRGPAELRLAAPGRRRSEAGTGATRPRGPPIRRPAAILPSRPFLR